MDAALRPDDGTNRVMVSEVSILVLVDAALRRARRSLVLEMVH